MARIILTKPNPLIENASGKLGRLIIKRCNGQIILSARPTTYTLSQKPECVTARNKFGTATKFASFVYGIPILKDIWKTSEGDPLNSCNKIIKANVKHAAEHFPTTQNTITPSGNHFQIIDVTIINDDINIRMREDFIKQPTDKLVVITALVDPVRKRAKRKFILMNTSPESICDFLLNWDTTDINLFKKIINYFAIIRKTEEGVEWSNTFAHEAIITRRPPPE